MRAVAMGGSTIVPMLLVEHDSPHGDESLSATLPVHASNALVAAIYWADVQTELYGSVVALTN